MRDLNVLSFELNKPQKKTFIAAWDVISENFAIPSTLQGFWSYVKFTYAKKFDASGLDIGEEEEHENKPDITKKESEQSQEQGIIIEDSPEYTPLQVAQKLDIPRKILPKIAQELGIKETTIYKWLERGKVKSAKKEQGEWDLNRYVQEERLHLAQRSQERIDWNNNMAENYSRKYGVSIESAKRHFRRLIRDNKQGNLSDKRKERIKKIKI